MWHAGGSSPFLHATTEGGGPPPAAPLQETAAASRSIRAVKAKEQQLRLEGVTGGKAGKMAASLVTGIKRKKKKRVRALCMRVGLRGLQGRGGGVVSRLSRSNM